MNALRMSLNKEMGTTRLARTHYHRGGSIPPLCDTFQMPASFDLKFCRVERIGVNLRDRVIKRVSPARSYLPLPPISSLLTNSDRSEVLQLRFL